MDLSNVVRGSRKDYGSTSRARRRPHTPEQIRELKRTFAWCPNPQKWQRIALAEKVGLDPRQIETWFLNRRFRDKAKARELEQEEVQLQAPKQLSNDNYKRESLAASSPDFDRFIIPNPCFPHGGTNPMVGSAKLPLVNSVVNELTEAIPSNISEHEPYMQVAKTSTSMPESLLHPDVIGNVVNEPNAQSVSMSMEATIHAMEELKMLAMTGAPLWCKSTIDGSEFLDEFSYGSVFNKNEYTRRPDVIRESSRYSGIVAMDPLTLANISMDPKKWMQCFPAIVVEAKSIGILNASKEGNPDGAIHLMRIILQVLSPLVPVREVYFLRYCKLIEEGLWAVADVSCPASLTEEVIGIRKLPSGFFIQDRQKIGYSQVTCIEHVELEGTHDINYLFRDHISGGIAFGATKWICSLQKTFERIRLSPAIGPFIAFDPVSEAISSRKGRGDLLKLSETMVNDFFSSINKWGDKRWYIVDMHLDIVIRSGSDSNNGSTRLEDVVYCAVTSFWVPLSPKAVFDLLRNEYIRPQWDALFAGHNVKEIANIRSGVEDGNWVRVFEDYDNKSNRRLILQESSTDSSGTSLVVCSPIETVTIKNMKTAEAPQEIRFLSSGVAIIPPRGFSSGDESSGSTLGAGSILTLGFHVRFSDLSVERPNMLALKKVKDLMRTSIQQLKAMMGNSPAH